MDRFQYTEMDDQMKRFWTDEDFEADAEDFEECESCGDELVFGISEIYEDSEGYLCKHCLIDKYAVYSK